ncbi:MAG: DUF177 domain-containing protein [Ignavibacteria bacterium]|nr:DUF177 domain-containing protein [Ignavibacteria bacterium]
MKIKISTLSEGRHFYDFEVPVSEIDLPADFIDNCIISVQLEKTKNQIFITSNIEYKHNSQCDRCLKNFKQSLATKYNMSYVYDVAHKDEYDENVVTVIPKEVDIIDITNDVKEYSILSVPLKNVCSENCKGLCAHCGKDLNFEACSCETDSSDPRWLELKKIINK